MQELQDKLKQDIPQLVRLMLLEDIGPGDLTASLIDPELKSKAKIYLEDEAIVCGQPWAEEIFKQLAPQYGEVQVEWLVKEGERAYKQDICHLKGSSICLLSAERSLLNLLQTLSATATTTYNLTKQLREFDCKLYDTRKTLPLMRTAQKYAVLCGGGYNQRFGLYDRVLIKENHLIASHSFEGLIKKALEKFGIEKLQVEVETLDQLKIALRLGVTQILLDNFSIHMLQKAVEVNKERATLEASGNITWENIRHIAATGVDRISVGSLTKNIHAVNYSIRFTE